MQSNRRTMARFLDRAIHSLVWPMATSKRKLMFLCTFQFSALQSCSQSPGIDASLLVKSHAKAPRRKEKGPASAYSADESIMGKRELRSDHGIRLNKTS